MPEPVVPVQQELGPSPLLEQPFPPHTPQSFPQHATPFETELAIPVEQNIFMSGVAKRRTSARLSMRELPGNWMVTEEPVRSSPFASLHRTVKGPSVPGAVNELALL